jgi:hypothetical protein
MARDELVQEVASIGHILLGNHAVNHTKGPAPAAFNRGPDLHSRGLDYVIHDGHTLRTPLGGCIPEFTYMGGLAPSLTTGYNQDFHLGSQKPMAHGELA